MKNGDTPNTWTFVANYTALLGALKPLASLGTGIAGSPIEGLVRMTAHRSAETLTLEAGEESIFLSTSIPATIGGGGTDEDSVAFCVDGKRLVRIMATLGTPGEIGVDDSAKDHDVFLSLEGLASESARLWVGLAEDGSRRTPGMHGGGWLYVLPPSEMREFAGQMNAELTTLAIDPVLLARAISATSAALPSKESGSPIDCLALRFMGMGSCRIEVAATNRHRLAVASVPVSERRLASAHKSKHPGEHRPLTQRAAKMFLGRLKEACRTTGTNPVSGEKEPPREALLHIASDHVMLDTFMDTTHFRACALIGAQHYPDIDKIRPSRDAAFIELPAAAFRAATLRVAALSTMGIVPYACISSSQNGVRVEGESSAGKVRADIKALGEHSWPVHAHNTIYSDALALAEHLADFTASYHDEEPTLELPSVLLVPGATPSAPFALRDHDASLIVIIAQICTESSDSKNDITT